MSLYIVIITIEQGALGTVDIFDSCQISILYLKVTNMYNEPLPLANDFTPVASLFEYFRKKDFKLKNPSNNILRCIGIPSMGIV